MHTPTSASRPRLFLALWPEEQIRKQICDRVSCYSDVNAKWVKRDNLHLTLAFLGNVESHRIQTLTQILSSVHFAPFELEIDYIYYLHRSRMLWLTPTKRSKPLLSLVKSIAQSLEKCHLPVEEKPFSAHITVARKARSKLGCKPTESIFWPVSSFCLVESKIHSDGPSYNLRHQWYSTPR